MIEPLSVAKSKASANWSHLHRVQHVVNDRSVDHVPDATGQEETPIQSLCL